MKINLTRSTSCLVRPNSVQGFGYLCLSLSLFAISIGHAQEIESPATQQINYRGGLHPLNKFQLKESTIVDAAQLLAELSGANIVATEEAGKKNVSIYLQNVTTTKAIEVMCRVSGLWYRKDTEMEIYRIMTTAEYERDIVVFKEEITKVFTLLHENVLSAATAVSDLYGERVILSLGLDAGGAGGATGGLGQGGIMPQGQGLGLARGQNSRGGAGGLFGGGAGSSLSRPTGGGASSLGFQSQRSNSLSMTSEQISQLESILQNGVDNNGVKSADLQKVTGREPDIYVSVNQQHNLLIVRTSDPEAMKDIGKLVLEIDRPIPQVLLEMKVLELTLGDSFKSAFDYELVDGPTSLGTPSSQVKNPLSPGTALANRHITGLGNFPLEDNRFVYQFLNDRVRARIQVMAGENRIQELATPMILAANNQSAKIFIGEERVLTTGVNTSVVTPGNGATTANIEPQTEVRDIGNTVEILPRINEDKTVTLTITQDSSSVSVGAATIPVSGGSGIVQGFNVDTVNTARIQGTIIATNNLTIAIGGLIRQRQNENRQKVPLLGDIPLLGTLFRRDVKENTKTELVLLITPRVMSTPSEGRAITERRLNELSNHPFLKKGEKALPRPKTTFDSPGGKILY